MSDEQDARRAEAQARAAANLIRLEETLEAIIADPGPDPRYWPEVVPNEAARRQAQEVLEQVRRDWAGFAGDDLA